MTDPSTEFPPGGGSASNHQPDGERPSPALQVRGLTKTYGDRRVVNDVSFELERGEVFGFLGPNGSGKTTTMRMALDLIKADSGTVSIFGSAPSRRALRRVGYLPEERGLFQRARVLDVLRYMGRLKGLSASTAEERASEMMSRVGLGEHLGAKVQGLSRGMAQLAQFAGALLHRPDLIILDEPFGGLDPLNVVLMKEIVREEQARGAAVIFSTHIMSDVEELCERAVLISDGRMLVYGPILEMKQARASRTITVVADRHPGDVPGVDQVQSPDGHYSYRSRDDASADTVLRAFLDAGISVQRFEVALPTLNEVFIEEVSRARHDS
ncbi:MAG: ATP-binding cassette domain-containing protein [Chloroflexi bacterium]|nr:ATP-binding cassette domain-containing protein [Chloroflexota bacterium]